MWCLWWKLVINLRMYKLTKYLKRVTSTQVQYVLFCVWALSKVAIQGLNRCQIVRVTFRCNINQSVIFPPQVSFAICEIQVMQPWHRTALGSSLKSRAGQTVFTDTTSMFSTTCVRVPAADARAYVSPPPRVLVVGLASREGNVQVLYICVYRVYIPLKLLLHARSCRCTTP